jgi:PAS domain S-box-containing protein
MVSRIKKFFSPPVFPEDEDKTRQARVLNTLAISVLPVLLFYGVVAIPFVFVEKLYNLLALLILLANLGVVHRLMHRGRLRLASSLFATGMWVVFTLFIPFAGGMTGVMVVFYLVGTVIAGLLLGTLGSGVYAAACSLAGLVMVLLESSGHTLPTIFPVPPIAGWLDMTFALLITVVVVGLVLNSLRDALGLTRQRLEERKRAEVALSESEQKFRSLVEQSSDGISIVDEKGMIVDWNQSQEQLTGLKQAEVLGRPMWEVQFQMMADEMKTPSMQKRLEDDFLRQMEANQSPRLNGTYEIIIQLPDGRRRDIQSILYQFKTDRGFMTGGIFRDITERKQAEEALRESEARFSRLSELTYEGIGISDQGRIVDANVQLASMLGYEPSELIGMKVMEFVAPESREQVMENIKAGFEGVYEHQAIRKDKSTFPVEIRARMFPYQDRQARVTSIRDITERKQAEGHLARQVERLEALHTIEQAMTSSMDLNTILPLLVREIVDKLQVDATSVLMLDPQTQVLHFAAKEGFKTEALEFTSLNVGTGLAGRAAGERKTVYVSNLAEMDNNPSLAKSIAEEGFVTYFGIPLIAKDQLRGVLEIFHRSDLDPDPNWVTFLETLAGQAAISIDNVHLLEMTQESLKETNALYQINQDLASTMDPEELLKNVVDLLQENFGYYYVQIFVLDTETGDFSVRAGSGEIGEQVKSQGYRLAAGEGIVGYTAETGKPFFTNDVDKVISFVRAPFLPDTKSELAVPIKTGTQFLGLLDIHQIPPAVLTERDVQLVSAVADQLAIALQKARLYTDLQESLQQEQATRSQLVHTEKLAVAGRLLASVSHELNNPLQAIQNALFLLQDEGALSTQGQQDMKIVLSETERMATLLERLRTSYQPVHAEDFQPVEINSIIEDVHALVATHLRHTEISYEFQADPELPSINGLRDQLKQVFLNLFMNAVDAMADGGRLSVSTDWLADKKQVLITVGDTGTGIDESLLPDIFDAFITNKEKGTGLGLAISYEIVLKHNGVIKAENKPEGGGKFSIWLPAENGDKQ